MNQDIYFPRWPSLEHIQDTYHVSARLLLGGMIIFGAIFLIAAVSLIRIVYRSRGYRNSMEYEKEKRMKDILNESLKP